MNRLITCVWMVMITSLKKIIMCSTETGIIWVSHFLRHSSLKNWTLCQVYVVPIPYVFCLSSEHKIKIYHVYHIRCALCALFNIYVNISLNKSVNHLCLSGLVNGQNWCETIKNILYLNITICAWIFHTMNRSLMSLEQHVDE